MLMQQRKDKTMPRRGPAKRIKIQPDPIYGNLMITKLVNGAMKDGKKSASEKQVYQAFEMIKEELKEEPDKVFEKALANIRPTMEVRPRRIGGAAYQVPIPVRGSRQDSLAIRWLIESARARSNAQYHTFAKKLSAEIIEAMKEEGGAVKKKQEMERVAEANRAFSHFRW